MAARFLVLIILLLPALAGAQRNLEPRAATAGEQRVALVIGNAAYENGPLKNPVNDARAIGERLQRLGFHVIKRENLKAKDIGPTLREFRSRLSAGAVAIFFYAGHGLQVKGVNYLPTVEATIEAEEDVYTQALDVSKVLELMDEAKTRVNLVFLDACRNNPFSRRFRSAANGLAKLDAASGTLISFATRPGSVAADGDGQNGLYTEYLLKHMEIPGLPIEQVLKRTGAAVKLASKGRQEPWSEGLIEGEFFFRPGAAPAAAAAAPAADPAMIEMTFWDSIKASTNPADFREYLNQYPNGRFSGIARNRLSPPPATQVALAAPSMQQTQPAPSAPLTSYGSLRAQNTYPAKNRYTPLFAELIEDIAAMTGGAVKIDSLPAGAVVPAFALLDAVSKRTLDAGWGSSMYHFGKDHAFGLIEGTPFGMDAASYAAWRSDPKVRGIIDRLYRRYGVVSLACAVSAPHGDLWTKKPIAKLDDLRGLKLRVVGPWIWVFERVGAAVNALPGGEIVPAMDRGLLDAAMFLDPRSDLQLGFPEVSRVYMIGQLSGARGLELMINAELWDRMPASARDGVSRACAANLNKTVVSSVQVASEAVREMTTEHKVRAYKLPDAVSAAIRQSWEKYRDEEAAKNATYAELLESMKPYHRVAQRPDQSAYGLGKR